MQGQWIWENVQANADEHAEFFTEFVYSKEQGAVKLVVSADSDYGVYVNGMLVEFGQYPDYPYYKVYDEVDITKYVKEGKNTLAFEVWYFCKSNLVYYLGEAGLFFQLTTSKNA